MRSMGWCRSLQLTLCRTTSGRVIPAITVLSLDALTTTALSVQLDRVARIWAATLFLRLAAALRLQICQTPALVVPCIIKRDPDGQLL